MLLRANANKPIISVALPSVASAAALAPSVRTLMVRALRALRNRSISLDHHQGKMPQHSWCFFAPSPSPEGIPQLPAAVRDVFSVITWADSRADLVKEVAASQAAADVQRATGDALRTIEASFLRTGGQPHLGMRPETRLGLAPASFAEQAAAANEAQARAMAQHYAALGGKNTRR